MELGVLRYMKYCLGKYCLKCLFTQKLIVCSFVYTRNRNACLIKGSPNQCYIKGSLKNECSLRLTQKLISIGRDTSFEHVVKTFLLV